MPIDRRAEIQIREVENFHRQLTNFAEYIETVRSNIGTPNYASLASIPREVKNLNEGYARVAKLNIPPERHRAILVSRLLYPAFSEGESDFVLGMAKANELRQLIKANETSIPMTSNANEEQQWITAPQAVLDQVAAMITDILEHYSD